MITRRRFVGGAVATALAPRLLTAPGDWRKRVVVVGAGLAGLTAALDLVEAGWDVVVLEARDRVGGRVLTARSAFSDGLYAELGGESIDDAHHALLDLVQRFGLTTDRRPLLKPYDAMVQWRGERTRLPVLLARRSGAVLRDYLRYHDAEAATGEGIDPAHPERARRAAELDALSADAFIRAQRLVPEADFLVRTQIRAYYAAEPRDVSMLFVAQQAALPGDPTGLEADFLSETQRIRGGNDRLPRLMARALGSRVRLRTQVTRVENHGERTRVVAGSATFDAAWVVVTTPPRPLRAIAFAPALPTPLAAAIAELDLGNAVKVAREYESAYWTRRGYSGFSVTDLPFGVAWAATDSRATIRGAMTQYVTGDASQRLSSLGDSQRIAVATTEFLAMHPEAKRHMTRRVATYNWRDDPFTGGAFAVWKPGQMARLFSPWQAGAGRIRFAGEHTANLPGYMESAVRSGHRVAAETGTPAAPLQMR